MARSHWLSINARPWYVRMPVKWALFLLTILVVSFPYPAALVRHVQRWRDPNRLVEPDAPEIQALVEELRPQMLPDLAPPEALKTVERFVYKKIEYAWDWQTWGMADYIPTVQEAVRSGREDCDGRAVVAASILRNFGFRADLVTDFTHVWVRTDKGETMSPQPTTAIVATAEGPRVQPSALAAVPRAVAYGIAVFPLMRELIVVAVGWLLLLRGAGRWPARVLGLALMTGGLLCLRSGGTDHQAPVRWMQYTGCGLMLLGVMAAWLRPGAKAAATNPPAE